MYIKINRRDIVQNYSMIARRIHYKMYKLATPPQEGNGLPLQFYGILYYCKAPSKNNFIRSLIPIITVSKYLSVAPLCITSM